MGMMTVEEKGAFLGLHLGRPIVTNGDFVNPNFYANSDPNPAMSDCYVQACRILAGSSSGISTVSRALWLG